MKLLTDDLIRILFIYFVCSSN